jgi:cytochrome c553
MKKVFTGLFVLSLLVVGCSKTNEETELRNSTGNTGPVVTCDTVNMKYSVNMQPILAANCYSCHANGRYESGVRLETYSQVSQRALSGQLLGVISHKSGFPAMPYQLPKLSDCNINKIKSWIDRGAQNN